MQTVSACWNSIHLGSSTCVYVIMKRISIKPLKIQHNAVLSLYTQGTKSLPVPRTHRVRKIAAPGNNPSQLSPSLSCWSRRLLQVSCTQILGTGWSDCELDRVFHQGCTCVLDVLTASTSSRVAHTTSKLDIWTFDCNIQIISLYSSLVNVFCVGARIICGLSLPVADRRWGRLKRNLIGWFAMITQQSWVCRALSCSNDG